MPNFGRQSEYRLRTVECKLQQLFRKIVMTHDCKILEGHRGKQRQNQYQQTGRSKVRWPNGEHNSYPSRAVDVAPYPIDWEDTKRFYFFAGYVIAKAEEMGLKLRWGGDWDRDYDLNDQDFMDLVHFELDD